MTTIAYKAGVLAGDTRTNAGGVICPGHCTKVFTLPDGSLFGASGDVSEIHQLHMAMEQHTRNMPELEKCEGLLVMTDGSLWGYEGSVWVPLEDAPFTAIGSGWVPAIVAMRFGASAEDAVRVAMEFDAFTGGEVRTVQLEPKLTTKKKPRSGRKRKLK